MAPRSTKAKKATDVKVTENGASKKGRGKAKNIDEVEQDLPEVDMEDDVAPVMEKKAKRGKKAQVNGEAQSNGIADKAAPPAKRGKKKVEPAPEEKVSNGDNSADEEANGDGLNGDHSDSNGDTVENEAPVATGRGRKKQTKKEEKPKEASAKGKKAKPSPDTEDKDVAEEKPKGKGRGRKAQPKPEADPSPDNEPAEEEIKTEPATKGRKKGPVKASKEKTPDSEQEVIEEQEEKTEEPKKKEPKSKKGQGKRAQTKDEIEEDDEEIQESASKKRKVNKKEEKGKGDAKEDEGGEVKPDTEVKAKGKRGKKADDDAQDAKRKRKPAPAEEKAADTKKKAPPKNKTTTNYDEIDFSNSSKNPQGKDWNFKIACWNVDGVRAWCTKGGVDYIRREKPDILCLQELKCSQEKLPEELTGLPGYHSYILPSEKDGYAGVGIYTTKLAMNVQYGLQNEELDSEGRIITAEYEQFYLICTYVPNAGKKLITLDKRLQWNEEFRRHVKELDKKKPVIICGDMNVAHNEIDLANPKTNRKNAGFTDEERAGMTDLLSDGFVDTFRHFNPDKTAAYTFWTYMMGARAKNVGWRLDYFIVSERLLPAVCDNVIRDQVFGSDHCPISLFLHLTSADKPK